MSDLDLSAVLEVASIAVHRTSCLKDCETYNDYERDYAAAALTAAAPLIERQVRERALRDFAATLRAERDEGASIRHDWAIGRLHRAADEIARGGAR